MVALFGEGNFVTTRVPVFQIICVVASRGDPLRPVLRHQLILQATVIGSVRAGKPLQGDRIVWRQVAANISTALFFLQTAISVLSFLVKTEMPARLNTLVYALGWTCYAVDGRFWKVLGDYGFGLVCCSFERFSLLYGERCLILFCPSFYFGLVRPNLHCLILLFAQLWHDAFVKVDVSCDWYIIHITLLIKLILTQN